MIEFRHLYYFEAAARELHFSRAAATAGVSPSTLSHGIRRLEHEVGSILFVRTSRRVELTDAGRRLAAALPPTLRRLETILRGLETPADPWEH